MISLKKFQKLELELFKSEQINEKMMFKVFGGAEKTTWTDLNGSGSGTDTVDCSTGITSYPGSDVKTSEAVCNNNNP